MDSKEMKYNREYLVVQANELVRSKQDELSLLESKLVRLAISQVLKESADFKTYRCGVSELAKYFGISAQNIYNEMKYLARDLMKKNIYIRDGTVDKQGNPNFKILHWIDYAEYKDGFFEFRLSENLKPYLLGLKQLFTAYEYGSIIELPTAYSIRLYEILISWKNSGITREESTKQTLIKLDEDEILFSIDYLRDYFNCKDKYANTGDFIKYVIEYAINGINENSNIQLSFRRIKEGRSIKYLVFKFGFEFPPDEEIDNRVKKSREIVNRVFEEWNRGI
ncbi:MAG: replication initiation protein [bacterium]|nr:replication initiation protein [bacterium]